ncbi:MAG TPA: hypothetical protein K8W23_05455 [Sellimonas intestinalis]|nr:hypothetical protein [Sellimonas intestinalis]
MNVYERLEDEAYNDGIDIITYYFHNSKIKALYCDGVIGLNSSLDSTPEKACILAEEIGHHNTSYGNIVDLGTIQNQKQELRARMWAYDRQIGLLGIIRCFEAGCRSQSEMAEFLDVTEDFLREALERYRQKYGICTSVDQYIIYFEPSLAVARIDEL